jgi:ribosome assembly protein 4
MVTLKGHTKWIMSLCWQPLHLNENCNILISTSKDATMRMWNTDSGTCLRAFGNHTKCVTKAIWGGENFIYSCSEDQTIKCWDFGGQYKMEFKKHAHWVNTIALSSDFV